MYARLRFFLFTSVALSLLASCSADEPEATSSGVAMEFSVGTEAPASRADAPVISEFAVFCDMTMSSILTPLIVMNNTPVTYNQTTGLWEYDGEQYWYPKYEHSFVAIHPISVVSATDAATKYSNSQLSFTYTLPSDYTKTADIIAATHRRYYESGSGEPVLMRFSHLMTLINVAPAYDNNTLSPDDYVEFLKFELSGFRTQATFGVTPASLQTTDRTDDRQYETDGHVGQGSLTIEFSEPKKILNDAKNVSLLDSDQAVIMLPQTFEVGSDAQIVLSYRFSYDLNTVKQIKLPLGSQKWEPGKSLTYRFSIDQKGPTFAETVITDWDVLDVGNIDVE